MVAPPLADQIRLSHILSDDLQPRINWAYDLEQDIDTLGAGYVTVGNGDPNGLVTKPEGYLFLDLTTPAVWQNQNGGTVWTQLGAGGGGSGLPDPWTSDQTSGEVVATVDDVGKTALTINAVAGQDASTPVLLLRDENGDDLLNVAQEPGGIGSTSQFGPTPQGAGVRWQLDDQAGDFYASFMALDGAGILRLYNHADSNTPAADNRLQLRMQATPAQTQRIIRVVFPGDTFDAFALTPQGAIGTSAGEPADGDINAGECFRWFDSTDGAARIGYKGKTDDGTVVFAYGPMGP